MDITISGAGEFAVMAFFMEGFDFAWEKADGGGLSLRKKAGAKRDMVSVWPAGGVWAEAVDANGRVIAHGGDGHSFYVPLTDGPVVVRQKPLADVVLSEAQMKKLRRTVTRTLLDCSPYDVVPGKLVDVIEWFNAKLAEIPAAARASAEVDLSTRYEHGESYSNIAITYEEPETDDEVKDRIRVERMRAALAEEHEREKLAALKRKYEPTP